MMHEFKFKLQDGREAVLTTERSESSYGQPVLVVDGVAYKAAQIVEYHFSPETEKAWRELGADTWGLPSGLETASRHVAQWLDHQHDDPYHTNALGCKAQVSGDCLDGYDVVWVHSPECLALRRWIAVGQTLTG